MEIFIAGHIGQDMGTWILFLFSIYQSTIIQGLISFYSLLVGWYETTDFKSLAIWGRSILHFKSDP